MCVYNIHNKFEKENKSFFKIQFLRFVKNLIFHEHQKDNKQFATIKNVSKHLERDLKKKKKKKENILFYSDCTHYPISTCTCNLDTATANPYDHVSDTPTSVRAEVQHGNYCTFLHIWMMLRSIELFPEDGWSHSLYPIGAHPPSARANPLGGFPSSSPSLPPSPSRGFFHCWAQVLP